MSTLNVDVYKSEREYRELTLSDRRVVKYLILYRDRMDAVNICNHVASFVQAEDTFESNQEIIALYSSLDKIIEECNFKSKQLKLLELLFEGNTIYDIHMMDVGFGRSATYDLFDRMIDRIVESNLHLWRESMKSQGYIA